MSSTAAPATTAFGGDGDADALLGGAGSDALDGGRGDDRCSDADQVGPFSRCELP